MPFVQVNISEEIKRKCETDPEFKEVWEESRMEYRILGELIKLRKAKGLTQADIAEKTGSNQRVISRIEKHEQSPTLKTLCSLANALNVDILLSPRPV
jgi:DNA-binding XRE family transcriptional regulator